MNIKITDLQLGISSISGDKILSGKIDDKDFSIYYQVGKLHNGDEVVKLPGTPACLVNANVDTGSMLRHAAYCYCYAKLCGYHPDKIMEGSVSLIFKSTIDDLIKD